MTNRSRAGSKNSHWRGCRIITEHGYVKLQVGKDHPLADPNGYAYEHVIVWASAGRAIPGAGEILHHRNDSKADNRLANLTVLSRAEHIREHHPAKVTPEQAAKLRDERAAGATVPELMQRYGIGQSSVYRILGPKAPKPAPFAMEVA
jgi:hypothetical protein